MIKKRYLFGLAVFCSLFVLLSCNTKQEKKDPELGVSEERIDFASLKQRGFVPKVVRLGDSYINDKIESKAKRLSYEYYYFRINNGEDFNEVKNIMEVFAPGKRFHTATIDEGDAGDASKTKLKYEKLTDVNGGELYIGTKFILGVRIIDQSNNLVYHSMSKMTVIAPQAAAEGGKNMILLPGNQTGCSATVVASSGDTLGNVKYDDKTGKTTYSLSVSENKLVSLEFTDLGKTNQVLVTP